MTEQSKPPRKQQVCRRSRKEAEELFLANMKLVPHVISKMGFPITEDIVQDGYIGLWQASLRYDGGRHRKFSAYAVPAIRNSIIQAWRPTEKNVTAVVSLNQTETSDENSGTPENIIGDIASEARFQNVELRLYFDTAFTDVEKKVASMVVSGLSKRQIGKLTGHSDSWVTYRISEIRKKLKKDF